MHQDTMAYGACDLGKANWWVYGKYCLTYNQAYGDIFWFLGLRTWFTEGPTSTANVHQKFTL